MKFTYLTWFTIFILGWMTAGFFPALLLSALAVGGSISLGFAQQDKLLGSSSKKYLG